MKESRGGSSSSENRNSQKDLKKESEEYEIFSSYSPVSYTHLTLPTT